MQGFEGHSFRLLDPDALPEMDVIIPEDDVRFEDKASAGRSLFSLGVGGNGSADRADHQ